MTIIFKVKNMYFWGKILFKQITTEIIEDETQKNT